MERFVSKSGFIKNGTVDWATQLRPAIPENNGVKLTARARNITTLKLVNANSGFITLAYITDRQADDVWSTADNLFRQKSTAKLFETPVMMDHGNPFHTEVLATEAMPRLPEVEGDKMDDLLSALQVLTDTLNSGKSFQQVNAPDVRYGIPSDGTRDVRRDDQLDVRDDNPRDFRRDGPRDFRYGDPRSDPRDVRQDNSRDAGHYVTQTIQRDAIGTH